MRWAVLVCVCCLGFGSVGVGEDLLTAMLEAHGGLARYRALSDWHIVAHRRISQDGAPLRERYVESMSRRGGVVRTLLVKERTGETLVFGHDGERGFALANGEVRADDDAAGEGYYRAHGEFYLRAIPFKWADPGVRVRALGMEDDGGHLLEVRAEPGIGPDDGDVWVALVDGESFRLREARLTHRGSREIVYRYSDYREVAGLWVPFRLEYWSDGVMTGENVIESFDVDVGLEPERFTPAAHRR